MKGKIIEIMESQSGTSQSGNEWTKIDFVIDNGDKYNPEICFTAFGKERVDQIKKMKVGDVVEVEFNIKCSKWKDRYFTSLDAWKITQVQDSERDEIPSSDLDEEVDELPF